MRVASADFCPSFLANVFAFRLLFASFYTLVDSAPALSLTRLLAHFLLFATRASTKSQNESTSISRTRAEHGLLCQGTKTAAAGCCSFCLVWEAVGSACFRAPLKLHFPWFAAARQILWRD